jgi:hypothetical protein
MHAWKAATRTVKKTVKIPLKAIMLLLGDSFLADLRFRRERIVVYVPYHTCETFSRLKNR